MPRNSGIKNREAYIQRLLEEDKKIAGKDSPYGRYLQSLTRLMELTNEIYQTGGQLDRESYEKLVQQYTDAAHKSGEYKEKTFIQTRRNVVDFLQKIIIKDLQVLNSMDKEKLGTIDDVFDASRTVRVVVPQDMSQKVGSQNSDRFAMKTLDGKKGYFTARTDTARLTEWKTLLNEIQEIGLDKEDMDVFNRLRFSHEFRQQIMDSVLFGNKSKDPVALVGRYMGFFGSIEEASYELAKPERKKLATALKLLQEKSSKLLASYHMQERLGYDFYTRNDNKNAAMHDVAKLMGCEHLIAKAVPMVVVNGKKVLKGTFMEHVEGSDLGNLKGDDPLLRYNVRNSPFNKQLYRDLADLQVLDYICGNIDRHKGNMIFKTAVDDKGKMKLTGVTGIDNDASFPEGNISDEFALDGRNPRIFKPQNFRYVTRKTAEFISNMNRGQLEIALRGNHISSKAIDQAWKRVKDVKKVLAKMKSYNITYADDLNEKSYASNEPEGPFYISEKMAQKPSIFTGFDIQVRNEINWEIGAAVKEQQQRYAKEQKMHGGMLNVQEHKEFKDAQAAMAEANVPQSEGAGKEQLLLMDLRAIRRMGTLMERVNRLKTPTEEFVTMRTAVASLCSYARELSDKINSNTALTEVEYKEYENRLKNLKEASSGYIDKKGLSPKTGNGVNRLKAATSFLTRSDMFSSNLEKIREMKDPVDEKDKQEELDKNEPDEMDPNQL